MSNNRRRIIRFPAQTERNGTIRQRQIDKLCVNLEEERKILARRLIRLKRAFHSFEKHQRTIVRLERQLSRLQEE